MPTVVSAPNGQYVRWPAHIRRARSRAVGLAAGIRVPLECPRGGSSSEKKGRFYDCFDRPFEVYHGDRS